MIKLGSKELELEQQIDNCSQVLGVEGKQLIAGMDFRGDQPKFYGILPEMSNQLGYGDGTTISDGNGADGVIVKKDGETDGFMQIGEGYENFSKGSVQDNNPEISSGGDSVVHNGDGSVTFNNVNAVIQNFKFNEIIGDSELSNSKDLMVMMDLESDISQPFKVGIYVDIDGVTSWYNGSSWSAGTSEFIPFTLSETGKREKVYKLVTLPATGTLTNFRFGNIYRKESMTTTIWKTSITPTSTPVPFVKSTAPNGRLVYNELWISETHSFIFSGVTCVKNGIMFFTTSRADGTQSGVENFFLSSSLRGHVYDCYITKDIFYVYDLTTQSEVLVGKDSTFLGLSAGYLNLTRSLLDQRPLAINYFSVYKGNLTNIEFNSELAKIKSTGFQLPNSGVIENIPYAKKKSDDYGSLKTHIEVDDTRDLALLEEESMWEIIKLADNTVSYASVKLVTTTWTITGALDNVSGMLRVQYPAKIRRL